MVETESNESGIGSLKDCRDGTKKLKFCSDDEERKVRSVWNDTKETMLREVWETANCGGGWREMKRRMMWRQLPSDAMRDQNVSDNTNERTHHFSELLQGVARSTVWVSFRVDDRHSIGWGWNGIDDMLQSDASWPISHWRNRDTFVTSSVWMSTSEETNTGFYNGNTSIQKGCHYPTPDEEALFVEYDSITAEFMERVG
ncbi:hypothetical protein BLNAU_21172 [Blattamonas nauphoetae]|uniref:Uncharacterized protein n=1 Tax=Blattamonas nauphoetae TaxID=2049346 RepID=A0ABQ9WYV7_9EUKA|nr:hypothetical protein BLNAU_21172 [Blattamonas nauphoetae]